MDHAGYESRLQTLKAELQAMESGDIERGRPVELDQTRQGRLSRMDALQGQAMSAAVRRRRADALRRIDAAIERLREGEFGYCTRCGEEIDARRLDIDPATPQCRDCAGGA